MQGRNKRKLQGELCDTQLAYQIVKGLDIDGAWDNGIDENTFQTGVEGSSSFLSTR